MSWRSAPSGLTLDVAAGPLAVDFRTVGNRIYAVTPAYPGDAARASWLESGYFVSAAGGQTIEEIVKLAAEIEAVDALALALASVEVESHLDRLPVVSRHRSTVADGAIELASRDIGQVICYATQAIRDCKAADLLLTATWFETNGSIVVVGAFPTRSGSVRVEIDGAAVAPVEDDGYMWIDVDLGQTDRFTFALTVGDVPTQSIDVIVEKAP